jgi:hypothetical protein
MAAKKKKLATPVPVTPEAPPAEATAEAVKAPRIKFFFGPYAYYAVPQMALPMMAIEAVTRGMKLPALKELSRRFSLKLEAYADAESDTMVTICERDVVYVPPPAKKVRIKKASKKASAKK